MTTLYGNQAKRFTSISAGGTDGSRTRYRLCSTATSYGTNIGVVGMSLGPGTAVKTSAHGLPTEVTIESDLSGKL